MKTGVGYGSRLARVIGVVMMLTVATPVFAASVTGVSPAVISKGASDTVVTVSGVDFISGDTVRANGVLLSTTLIASSSLTAVVPASILGVDQSVMLDVVDDLGVMASGSVVLTVGAGGNVQAGLSMDQWHTIVFALLGGLGAYVFIAGIGRLW